MGVVFKSTGKRSLINCKRCYAPQRSPTNRKLVYRRDPASNIRRGRKSALAQGIGKRKSSPETPLDLDVFSPERSRGVTSEGDFFDAQIIENEHDKLDLACFDADGQMVEVAGVEIEKMALFEPR